MSKELWKDVVGYEGLYQVSNQGRVKSLCRAYRNGVIKRTLIRKVRPNRCGYPLICFYRNNKTETKSVHRLVALVFVPNPENKPEVNHINGIKSDNRAENLEWCSKSENFKHAYKTGLIKSLKGESHGRAKLTEKDVLKIRQMYEVQKITQTSLASIYGVSQTIISFIVRGKTWTHI